jgi:DNA-binding IclR family transcriptional regulator
VSKSEPEKGRQAKGIQSIEVGYRVLIAVQRGPAPVQLSEVAKRAGLSTGATHNYLVSLARTGLVEQEGRGTYRLGPSAFALSLASFQQLNGYEILRAEAKRLHESTGESTAVTVWSQAGPVSVYTHGAKDSNLFDFRTGLIPILGSAAGMIFAASATEADVLLLVENELAGLGQPREQAGQIIANFKSAFRENGYAYFSGRGEFGTTPRALAAPAWDASSRIVFTLSVLGRSVNIDPHTDKTCLNALLESCQRATALLGGAPARYPASAA